MQAAACMGAKAVPPHLREDAFQEAAVGVLEALPRFDPSRGASLKTFLSWRAIGAVRDWSRRQDPLSRRHRRLVKEEGCESPTAIPLDRLHDGMPFQLADCRPSPETQAIWADVPARIAGLKPQSTRVLTAYYWEGRSLKQIGSELGLHPSRAVQIKASALKQLRRAFDGAAMRSRALARESNQAA